MRIHEYQAKSLLRAFNIPTPESSLITKENEIQYACYSLSTEQWVIKAQIHAGARKKNGGVVICHTMEEVISSYKRLMGKRLTTDQTDEKGLPVKALLVEEFCNIERAYYVSFLVDRSSKKIALLCSAQGGSEIEAINRKSPRAIFKTTIDPLGMLGEADCREMAVKLKIKPALVEDFIQILLNLYAAFISKNSELIEINPLVVTQDQKFLALDCKIEFDDSAMFRHETIARLHDPSQEDEKEAIAKQHKLNFISLQGDIGCLVNGAGLAMATMDLIESYGGKPANFLDVGGNTTPYAVVKAFELMQLDGELRGILVNIFGGIVRCNLIAEGLLEAIKIADIKIPIVVRLEGTNADIGRKMLIDYGQNVIVETSLTQAAIRVCELRT